MIIKDVVDARILVELGAQLSFAGAARKLGIPPATLSRRIAEMEGSSAGGSEILR